MVNDPAAMRAASLLGLRVTLIVKADALPDLESSQLMLLPSRWVDAGPISIYYASRNLLPLKTRVFVDYVVEVFQRERYAERFAGRLGQKPQNASAVELKPRTPSNIARAVDTGKLESCALRFKKL